jgi:hypothetical protein
MHASIQEIQTACYTVLIQPTPPKLLAIECARVLVCERVCTCAQMAGEVERHAPHERVLVLLLLLVVVVVACCTTCGGGVLLVVVECCTTCGQASPLRTNVQGYPLRSAALHSLWGCTIWPWQPAGDGACCAGCSTCVCMCVHVCVCVCVCVHAHIDKCGERGAAAGRR